MHYALLISNQKSKISQYLGGIKKEPDLAIKAWGIDPLKEVSKQTQFIHKAQPKDIRTINSPRICRFGCRDIKWEIF